MLPTSLRCFVRCLLLVGIVAPAAGQAIPTDLDQVSKRVENYFSEKKAGWKHETAPPATPPGSTPSRDVVIHFWSSESCLTAELTLDGVSYGAKPVPCRIKLAIDQSPTATEARARLSNFARNQYGGNLMPVEMGDKGYVWNGSNIVFIKGRFTFWLDGGVDLRVGDFAINREFIERLAKEIEQSVVV